MVGFFFGGFEKLLQRAFRRGYRGFLLVFLRLGTKAQLRLGFAFGGSFFVVVLFFFGF